MPFLLAEILNFQGSTHRIGVGSFSYLIVTIQNPIRRIAATQLYLLLMWLLRHINL